MKCSFHKLLIFLRLVSHCIKEMLKIKAETYRFLSRMLKNSVFYSGVKNTSTIFNFTRLFIYLSPIVCLSVPNNSFRISSIKLKIDMLYYMNNAFQKNHFLDIYRCVFKVTRTVRDIRYLQKSLLHIGLLTQNLEQIFYKDAIDVLDATFQLKV